MGVKINHNSVNVYNFPTLMAEFLKTKPARVI